MPLVKHVHNGHHFHGAAVAVFRIHVVLYGNKPNTKRREHIVHILSDLDVVSAEAGKVFDNDSIYRARFGVVQKPLHFRSLESSTRHAVVYIFVVDLETVFLGIFPKYRPLMLYGYRFTLTFVLLGKSVI